MASCSPTPQDWMKQGGEKGAFWGVQRGFSRRLQGLENGTHVGVSPNCCWWSWGAHTGKGGTRRRRAEIRVLFHTFHGVLQPAGPQRFGTPQLPLLPVVSHSEMGLRHLCSVLCPVGTWGNGAAALHSILQTKQLDSQNLRLEPKTLPFYIPSRAPPNFPAFIPLSLVVPLSPWGGDNHSADTQGCPSPGD